MASMIPIKPFSPEDTRRILDHLQEPAVFLDMTCGWPVLHWTAEHLSRRLHDKLIRFRLGRKEDTNTPLFETQCSYVEASVSQFLCWTRGQTEAGPFSEFSLSHYWAYADYKYIAMLFQDQPDMFEDVKWSDFGFEGRNGKESTLWIGTEGANTPCHLDTYGCNLVLQVQGRKRWHLFPPGDTAKLYPTRIPYEESSIFSQVDVLCPDPRKFPAFQGATALSVTLLPGQVLFVPRHWWHYVESVDPITVSVNSWIELDQDDVARVTEAVTRTVICAVKNAPSVDNSDNWLNPTEERNPSHDENMQYLNLAVKTCAQRKRNHHKKPKQDQEDTHPVKRDSSGRTKKSDVGAGFCGKYPVPFGRHLIPVKRRAKEVLVGDTPGDVGTRPAPAGTLHQENTTGGTGSARSGPADSQHDSNEGSVTTNDLLDCLLHPDVIARVTELLLERHRGGHI